MPDPNATYKQAFADLTEKLGRVPTPRDQGWLQLHQDYARAWSPATETIRQSGSAAGTQEEGFSRELAPQASAIGAVGIDARESASEPLTNPGTGAKGDPDRTTGDGASGPPRIDERATGGVARVRAPRVYEGRAGRGPNGGVMAVCGECGVEWERPLRRGRPAYRCGKCRA